MSLKYISSLSGGWNNAYIMPLQHNHQVLDQLRSVYFEAWELSPDSRSESVTIGSRVCKSCWKISHNLIAERADLSDEKWEGILMRSQVAWKNVQMWSTKRAGKEKSQEQKMMWVEGVEEISYLRMRSKNLTGKWELIKGFRECGFRRLGIYNVRTRRWLWQKISNGFWGNHFNFREM